MPFWLAEQTQEWSLMIFCARATRGRRRVAWSSSCSRNAHAQKVLVRRAHSRIDQATLENEVEDWITRAVGDQSSPPSRGRLIEERCIFRPEKTPGPFLWLLALTGAARLRGSLGIGTTGSYVPHPCLNHAHTAFMPTPVEP